MNSKTESSQLYNDLFRKITHGEYAVGGAIPSEYQLAAGYHISRPTVRRVLEQLCKMRLIQKRPGMEAIVTDPDAKANEAKSRPLQIGTNLINSLSPHYTMPILQGINDIGYPIQFHKISDDTLNPAAKIDGYVLLPSNNIISEAGKLGKPTVCLNMASPFPEVASIRINNYLETTRSLDYLYSTGSKRIVPIGYAETPQRADSVSLRCQAWTEYNKGMKGSISLQNGLPSEKLTCFDYRENCQRFIQTIQDADTLFFFTAHSFISFTSVFEQFSAKPLKSYRIMVFDDISRHHEYDFLPCSFIQMPLEEMGRLAARHIHDSIFKPSKILSNNMVLPCSMVIRYPKEDQL